GVGEDRVRLLVALHPHRRIKAALDPFENRVDCRDVHPLPVVPRELRLTGDVLRAEDVAADWKERRDRPGVEAYLVVALRQNVAKEVTHLDVLDLDVETGGAQLLLED